MNNYDDHMSMPEPESHATLISCPGCTAVLSVIEERDGAHLRFVCSVGHSYSLQTLLQAKEDDVERAFWSAAAFLEHIQMITGLFFSYIERQGLPIDKQGLENRRRQAETHGRQIRHMIDETEVTDMEPHLTDERA